MNKGVLIGIIALVVVAVVAGFFLMQKPSGDNASSSGSGTKECGTIPESVIAAITSPTLAKNDVSNCMSENMKDCKKASFSLACSSQNCVAWEMEIIDNSDKCVIKYSETLSGDSITCDFGKDFLKSYYSAAGDKSWMTSLAISLAMAMDMKFSPSGSASLDLNMKDGTRVSIPCTVIK